MWPLFEEALCPVTHCASVTMDEEGYWWGRGTTSSLSNIVFWTLNKTKRKCLYLFDDKKWGNYYFSVKILWRKKIFVWTKSVNPTGFFSRVLLLAQLQVQHSMGGHPVHRKNLGAHGPFSWEMVGREPLPQERREQAISGQVLVGGLIWAPANLGLFPTKVPLLFCALHL